MTVLDTSILVSCFAEPAQHMPALLRAVDSGEDFILPALVLYEWLRGPRRLAELKAQEALLPAVSAIPFGSDEAAIAARLYREVSQPRNREVDICIAACAILRKAQLWTLNRDDFKDIPGLRLAKF